MKEKNQKETKVTMVGEFTLRPLPYKHNALEPHISAETINYHYGKHLQTYITNLNKLLTESPLKGCPLKNIIVASEGALFNNAAQVFNHQFYFETFSPNAKHCPDGALMKAINERWGSLDAFKKDFEAAATGIFGSGWAWLATNKDGKLFIEKTSNADNPLTKGLVPLMTADVWEHAYYLDYQNRRAEHLGKIWSVIDWEVIEERYNSR